MSIGDTSQVRVASILEATWGTTPNTPALQVARFTGESLNVNQENVVSDEIRSDRNVSDQIPVGRSADGSLNFELSYGTFDDFIAAALYSDWATNAIKNGIVKKSFTLEKFFELGTTDAYMRYTGMMLNQFNLSIEAKKIITGSFSFLGKFGSAATAIIAGATYPAATTTGVMSAGLDFASLAMVGISPAPKLLKVDMAVNNNLRPQPVVGSLDLVGVGVGRFEVTGSITAYFENLSLYNAYLNGTAASLSFTLGTTTLQKYNVNMPTIKFQTGKVLTPGNNQDVVAEMTYRALYNTAGSPANNATLLLTRAVA